MGQWEEAQESWWQGRSDGGRVFERVCCVDEEKKVPDKSVAVMGFSSDEGVKRNEGRPGAEQGPLFLRKKWGALPWHGERESFFYDLGTVTCQEGQLAEAQQTLAVRVASVVEKGCLSVVLGGGHEVSWGHFQGLAQALPQSRIGIINVDAHFDLRPPLPEGKGSSGTPFLQIAQWHEEKQRPFHYLCIGIQHSGNTSALFRKAEELKAQWVHADHIHAQGPSSYASVVTAFLEGVDVVYLTLCLDAFAQAFAPGVSAPQPFGLLPSQALPLLEMLRRSGKLVALDVAELCPRLDRDEMTAALGAHLLWRVVT